MAEVCKVCNQESSKYTCPRCEVPYCSLSCYKNHGEECLNAFYQQQVQSELESRKATGEERRHLEKMLHRLRNLDQEEPEEDGEDEEDEEDEMHEALRQLAEKDELVLEDLPESLRERFLKDLRTTDLGQYLEPWQPWWLSKVMEVFPDTREHICCSAGRAPNACVAFSILQMIYAYVHMARSFNGDWMWDAGTATGHVLAIAKSLHSKAVYESTAACLNACMEANQSSHEINICCMQDVADLLVSGDYVARVADDLALLLEKAKADFPGKENRIARVLMKLAFLRSFGVEHFDMLKVLSASVSSFAEELHARHREAGDRMEAKGLLESSDGVILPPRSESRVRFATGA